VLTRKDLSKDFFEKIVFELILKDVKVLSRVRGFANMYKLSHDETKVLLIKF